MTTLFKKIRKDDGQLAIGIAFLFTAVLVFFALVFQSSFLLREKMKLQQTTDFAALVGADTQKHALNAIREINQSIERHFESFQLAMNAPHCDAILVFSNVALVVEKAANTGARLAGSRKSGKLCDACKVFDEAVRYRLAREYARAVAPKINQILDIIRSANLKASENSLAVYLDPQNLPIGLFKRLANRLGGKPSAQALRSDYENGQLTDEYEIYNALIEAYPLFEPDMETRTFKFMTYRYPMFPSPVGGAPLCSIGVPSKPGVIPTAAKVVKKGDSLYTPSFLTGVSYMSKAAALIQNLKAFVKDPFRSGEADPYISDQGKKRTLFRAEQEIWTTAMAKPFGGTLPRGAKMLGATDDGDPGEKYTGTKLIGIADTHELGGYRYPLDGHIAQQGAEGQIQEEQPYYTEDFLH